MSQKLPPGSLILVTGANGFIASHICDQLLSQGYRVRGTVRDAAKSAWLKEYFDQKHGADKFELFQVPDISAKRALDEAVKGCSALSNTASDLSMDTDPNKTVAPMIAAVEGALEAASKEPGMKAFVQTSSSMAASRPFPNKEFHVGRDTWNESDIKQAWEENNGSDDNSRRWAAYGASKAQGEQAAWKFAKEKKPHFSINAILPNANFGPILVPEKQQGSTAAWIKAVYDPERWPHIHAFVPPQYYVHVQDTARLHAAVLTDPAYNGERLFAYAEPFYWNDVLARLRKITPNRDVPEDLKDDSKDLSTVENARALEILTKSFGQKAWLPIDDALKENVKAL